MTKTPFQLHDILRYSGPEITSSRQAPTGEGRDDFLHENIPTSELCSERTQQSDSTCTKALRARLHGEFQPG